MNDERESAKEAHEKSLRAMTTQQNGRELTVSDDALSEVAKIGAEDVRGVRVVSAEVEERALVHLIVDIEYGKPVSELVEEVCKKAKKNIDRHLPDREDAQVKVTIASVRKGWGRVRGLWVESVRFLKEKLGPWVVPLLAVVVGLIILWAITTFINETETTVGDVVLVLLLAMPILIYGIVSGKLTELKGPGGVEAKFTAAAATPVAGTASHDLVSSDELLTVSLNQSLDRGEHQLGKRLQRFTEIQPIVMTIRIDPDSYSEHSEDKHIDSLLTYVAQLSRSRNFALIAFLDTNNNFVAYMPGWVISNIINNRLDDQGTAKDARDLFRIVVKGNQKELVELPGVVRDRISPNATNAEALGKMVASNLDVIVVVDENNRLKGVLERQQVLSKIVLALTPNR